MYYASGCSIAKFPEDGVVITQTFKDQGKGRVLLLTGLVPFPSLSSSPYALPAVLSPKCGFSSVCYVPSVYFVALGVPLAVWAFPSILSGSW